MPRNTLNILLLSVAISSLLVATVTAAVFPGSRGLDDVSVLNVTENVTYGEIVRDPLYTVENTVMPWEMWVFVTLLGLGFLTISVVLPERGELVTGLLAVGFNFVSWTYSTLVGFTTTTAATLETVMVVQPVILIYAAHNLSYLFQLIFWISVLNVILGIFNLLQTKVGERRMGME